MPELSRTSRQRLVGVNKELVRVVERAIQTTTMDFVVSEGLRTIEQQKKYVASGKSKTMKSRHLTGHAVDLIPVRGDHDNDSTPNNEDKDAYVPIVVAMKKAAKELGVEIECGADWGWDYPHFQLSSKKYPA